MKRMLKMIEFITQFLFFYCVQIFADRMILDECRMVLFSAIATLLFGLLFTLERSKISWRWLYVISVFVTAGTGLMLAVLFFHYAMIYAIPLMALYSLITYFMEPLRRPEAPGWFFAALMVAMNVIADLLGYRDVSLLLYLLLGCYLFLMLLYRNQNSMAVYLHHRASAMQMDARRISYINNLLITVTALISVLAMCVARFLSVEYLRTILIAVIKVIMKLWEGLVFFFTWLFSGQEEVPIADPIIWEEEDAKRSFLANFDFLMYILAAAIIIVVLYMSIKALVKFLMRKRSGRVTKNETDGYVMIESMEWLEREKKQKKKSKHKTAEGTSYSARIRRMYQKAMHPLEKKQLHILRYSSPKDQVRELEKAGGKLSQDCVAIYEKARYSEEGANRDEYKNMKGH